MSFKETKMRSLAWLLSLALIACDTSDDDPGAAPGGQFGEEAGGQCEAIDIIELELEEVSPLSFSAEEMIALLEAEHPAQLTWTDGTKEGPTITQAGGTNPGFID